VPFGRTGEVNSAKSGTMKLTFVPVQPKSCPGLGMGEGSYSAFPHN
jgi:hypothetical protein